MSPDKNHEELQFIDSNIFFYSRIMDTEYGESCAQILRRLADRKLLATTSTLVILEVANSLRKFGPKRQVKDVVDSIFSLEIRVFDVTSSDVRNAIAISQRVNISPYDCTHVSIMQRAHIRNIISADNDFDRVPGIKRRDPKAFPNSAE